MAPAAKINQKGPDTLPADFCEWDSGSAPGTLPDDFSGFDSAPEFEAEPIAPPPPPKAQPPARPVADRAPVISSATAEAGYAEAKVLFQSAQPSRAYSTKEDREDQEDKKSKVPLFAIAAVVALVAVGGVYKVMSSGKSAPKPAVVSQSASSPTGQGTSTGSASTPDTTASSSPVAAESTPAAADAAPKSAVQSQQMMTQLNAASRISRDIKGGEQDAPGSANFGSAGMEGLHGNNPIGNVFGSNGAPKVKAGANEKVGISAGVARGLLVQKTAPLYPTIAKAARVSGTVVLQATISKSGAIESLHAISGPATLRQSALDAVKSWRYKPYMVNNQPVAVDTTVEVIFSLGG